MHGVFTIASRGPNVTGAAQELEALRGWRSGVSFMLELGDVAAPLLRSLFARVSAAISWLLVTLIGRSLGLVFRGVRESLGRGGRPAGQRPVSGQGQHAAQGRATQSRHFWWPTAA